VIFRRRNADAKRLRLYWITTAADRHTIAKLRGQLADTERKLALALRSEPDAPEGCTAALLGTTPDPLPDGRTSIGPCVLHAHSHDTHCSADGYLWTTPYPGDPSRIQRIWEDWKARAQRAETDLKDAKATRIQDIEALTQARLERDQARIQLKTAQADTRKAEERAERADNLAVALEDSRANEKRLQAQIVDMTAERDRFAGLAADRINEAEQGWREAEEVLECVHALAERWKASKSNIRESDGKELAAILGSDSASASSEDGDKQ
jgi:hypothetical protein